MSIREKLDLIIWQNNYKIAVKRMNFEPCLLLNMKNNIYKLFYRIVKD